MTKTPDHEQSITAGAVFAGIGGFCEGFRQAGVKTIWAIEQDPKAVITYENNFPDCRTVRYTKGADNEGLSKDIRDVGVNLDSLEQVDIITAGFPCQSFSQAGDRRGFEDDRGKLFFELIRLIKEFGEQRPKLLIFENVPYLKLGQGGAWFSRIKYEIQSAGYWFSDSNARILNPLDLGLLPQRRERLFMVAASTTHFKSNKFVFPTQSKNNTPDITEYIDLNGVKDNYYFLDPENRYFTELMAVLKSKQEGSLVQYRKYYARDIKQGICPTLTANMGQGGHNVPFLRVGRRIRKLTEFECARLQGFERLSFPDAVSKMNRYMQIGNSVAVPVAKLLAQRAVETIKGIC